MVYGRRRKTGRTREHPPPGAARAVDLVRTAHPPGDHHPGHVQRRAGHRRRAPLRRGRPERQPAAAGPPHLRTARTGPPPLLPAADVRHHPHLPPVLGRRPRLLQHLLQMHPRHRQPQTRRRPPRTTPAPSPSAKTPSSTRSATSSTPAYSAPTTPPSSRSRSPATPPRPPKPTPATATGWSKNSPASTSRSDPRSPRSTPSTPTPRTPPPRPCASAATTLHRTAGRTRGHPDPARGPRQRHDARQRHRPARPHPLLTDTIALHPERIQAALYQAFDIQALYKDDMNQVTFFATITTSTPQAVAAILTDAGYDPITAGTRQPPAPATTAPVYPLAQPPMRSLSTTIMDPLRVRGPDQAAGGRGRGRARPRAGARTGSSGPTGSP